MRQLDLFHDYASAADRFRAAETCAQRQRGRKQSDATRTKISERRRHPVFRDASKLERLRAAYPVTSDYVLAAEFGVSNKSIWRWAKREGLTKAAEYHQKLHTLRSQQTRERNLSGTTRVKTLQNRGISPRDDASKIERFRIAYPTTANAVLAAEFGVHPGTIQQWARREDLKKSAEYLHNIRSQQTLGRKQSDAARTKISESRRLPLYDDAPQAERFRAAFPTTANSVLAAEFGVSGSSLARWAKREGLTKSADYRQMIQAQRMLGRKRSDATRTKLSETQNRSRQSGTRKPQPPRAPETVLKGPAHPNWKGGKPWERFKNPEYIAWRNAVLGRDGYVCQDCGRQCKKHEKGLAAHHIKPYARHPELRFEVSNGITLCRTCHMALHARAPAQKEKIPCACGCGTMIASVDPYGRARRFVNRHGKKLS